MTSTLAYPDPPGSLSDLLSQEGDINRLVDEIFHLGRYGVLERYLYFEHVFRVSRIYLTCFVCDFPASPWSHQAFVET